MPEEIGKGSLKRRHFSGFLMDEREPAWQRVRERVFQEERTTHKSSLLTEEACLAHGTERNPVKLGYREPVGRDYKEVEGRGKESCPKADSTHALEKKEITFEQFLNTSKIHFQFSNQGKCGLATSIFCCLDYSRPYSKCL